MSGGVRRGPSGHRIGQDHPRAAAPDEEVELVRELHEEHGLSYDTLSEKMERPVSTIRNWCTHRTRS